MGCLSPLHTSIGLPRDTESIATIDNYLHVGCPSKLRKKKLISIHFGWIKIVLHIFYVNLLQINILKLIN